MPYQHRIVETPPNPTNLKDRKIKKEEEFQVTKWTRKEEE